MFHEHQRPERNSFVTINEENINPDEVADNSDFTLVNFDKKEEDAGLTVCNYDIDSIMHYWRTTFGNGNVTVEPLDEESLKEPATSLSDIDVKAVWEVYGGFPRRINFGKVPPQSVVTRSFSINNSTIGTVEIEAPSLGSSLFMTGAGTTVAIPPNTVKTFAVTWLANQGELSFALTLKSNVLCEPRTVLLLGDVDTSIHPL